jgi:hypothetical protein
MGLGTRLAAAAQQVPAANAHQQIGRKPGGEFDDLRVERYGIRTSSACAIGDIDFDVDVVGQIRLKIEVGEAANRGPGRTLAKHAREAFDRGARSGGLHARQVERCFLFRREMADERRVPRRLPAWKRHRIPRCCRRRKVECPDQRPPVNGPHDWRKGIVDVAKARGPVPLVAREDLVGGIAGKRHRHVLLRHPREVAHRDGGPVGRLAVVPHDGTEHVRHRRFDDDSW